MFEQSNVTFFNFEFKSNPSQIIIEESNGGKKAIIQGTMLREGISRNGFLYTVEEMENIANQAVGIPIYIGSCTKLDSNYGIMRDGKHANFDENKIGRIIQAVFDPVKRIIKYIAEIINTKTHPMIVEEVKAGWGVSIGGTADADLIKDSIGRLFYKIKNMIFKHLQLLEPHINVGVEGSSVEGVEVQEAFEIQESMIFKENILRNIFIHTKGKTSVNIIS
jgi:hypothetical protein